MRLPLFSVTMAALLVGCGRSRPPCVYEIPEGYVGWVWIEFDRKDAPAIERKDGRLIFPIATNGKLSTSSRAIERPGQDEFYYVGKLRTRLPSTESWRGGGLIWGDGIQKVSGGGEEKTYEHFFVGTFQQYQAGNAVQK